MKKVYVLGVSVIVASLAGCTFKAPIVPTLSGDMQTVSGAIAMTGTTGDVMPQFATGEIDSGVVPMLAGSETVSSEQTGISLEVKTLIEERQTQPKDTTKLNEEDIGLMEKIIQKIQKIGK